MTDTELKTLKDNLWHSADMLRAGAHLAANKYGQPILGLIFLRYADVLFMQHKAEIDAGSQGLYGDGLEAVYDKNLRACEYAEVQASTLYDALYPIADAANAEQRRLAGEKSYRKMIRIKQNLGM